MICSNFKNSVNFSDGNTIIKLLEWGHHCRIHNPKNISVTIKIILNCTCVSVNCTIVHV